MAGDNWNFSVGCILVRGDEVLLARHTYGSAKGKLLIPGGYCREGELPADAAVRECYEETGVTATPGKLAAVRFHTKGWYAVFIMKYESGTPRSDGDENDFAGFIKITDALMDERVTGLTKQLLEMLESCPDGGLECFPEYVLRKGSDYALYGMRQ